MLLPSPVSLPPSLPPEENPNDAVVLHNLGVALTEEGAAAQPQLQMCSVGRSVG